MDTPNSSTNPITPNSPDMTSSHQTDASTMAQSQQSVMPNTNTFPSSPGGTMPGNGSMPPTAPQQTPVIPTTPVSSSIPLSHQSNMSMPPATAAAHTASSMPGMDPSSSGIPPAQTVSSAEPMPKEGNGKMVFLLVFVLVVVAAIGGYLLFMMYQKSQMQEDLLVTPPVEPIITPSAVMQEDPAIQELESVSSMDTVEALEEDVEASDFSTLDSDVTTLQQEL